ncbi:MAG: hypothetical protein ACI3XI_00920 [Eubacteriales bacterium]
MNVKKLLSSFVGAASLLLVAAMLCTCLCSCGVIIINTGGGTTDGEEATTVTPESTAPEQTEHPSDETTDEVSTRPSETTEKPDSVTFPTGRQEEAQSRLDALVGNIDISDFDIIIVSVSETADVLFPDEDSVLYTALMERNSMLYEKYGVDIRSYEKATGTDDLYAELAAAIKSGDSSSYYIDLFTVPARSAGRFLAGGMLRDMRSLPFYDTNEGNTAGNVGSARYFDLGDGTDVPEYLYSLYFNRTLLGEELSAALFRAGLNGTLSFETLLTAAKSVEGTHADIASVGGASLMGEISSHLLGIEYITKNSAGVPSLALTQSEYTAIDSLLQTLSGFRFNTIAEGSPSPEELFISGKVPFYLGTLGDIPKLYDKPIEWGLLPLPSGQKLGAVSDQRPVICLPVTNTRLEQTGIWLSGFNAASGEWLRDYFRDVAIRDYMRDNNSCLSLAAILERKAAIGFETLYADYYPGLADATYSAAGAAVGGSSGFSEVYLAKVSSVNKKLAVLP